MYIGFSLQHINIGVAYYLFLVFRNRLNTAQALSILLILSNVNYHKWSVYCIVHTQNFIYLGIFTCYFTLNSTIIKQDTLVTSRSSGILKAKQKLGRTFNSDKLGGIAFTKISNLTMCSAQEEAQAIVPASTGQHQHCTCSVLKIL